MGMLGLRLRSLAMISAATVLATMTVGATAIVTHAAPATGVSTMPRAWHVQVGAQSSNEAVQGMVYMPGKVTIDVGDTIEWQANSAEPHTVTFNPTPAEFANAIGEPASGGTIFNGSPLDHTNSGLIGTVSPSFTARTTYSLTFTKVGTYTYFCLVHPGMKGEVVVQPAGTPYPETQRQYNLSARIQRANIIASGYQEMAREDVASARATQPTVFVGGSDMQTGADVMLFMRPTIVVHVGQKVTFINNSMGPHTVTFGSEAGTVCSPDAPFCTYGDPTNYQGGQLNSGFLGAPFNAQPFQVTFNKVGTYTYHCALHDYMGMDGKVIVVP